MTPALIALAIKEVPMIIDGLKTIFKRQHPGEPEPTNEQVIAAFNQAFESSLAVDARWLAAHPKD